MTRTAVVEGRFSHSVSHVRLTDPRYEQTTTIPEVFSGGRRFLEWRLAHMLWAVSSVLRRLEGCIHNVVRAWFETLSRIVDMYPRIWSTPVWLFPHTSLIERNP